MIIKQKVIVEKEFWKPKEVSEKEWTEYWKKHADGHATNDDDFHKYHMEDSGSDLEILETSFVWNETATKHTIPFTDEAIDKLNYKDIKGPKKINGIKKVAL